MGKQRAARIAAAAARARAAVSVGVSLDEVLRTFRTTDQLSALEIDPALREISAMDPLCAKVIVSNACEGRSYAHLTLVDLDLLGDAPRLAGVDDSAHRSTRRSVHTYMSAIPLKRPPTPAVDEIAGNDLAN